MKLKDLLNKKPQLQEASTNPKADQLIKQLVDIASNGELDADQISDLNRELLTARRKWFSAKKSPDDRKTSAAKGKTTIILKKLSDDAVEQILNALKISRGGEAFSIRIGRHPDKELQKKFDHEYNILYPKLAAKAGITDKDAIYRASNSFVDPKA